MNMRPETRKLLMSTTSAAALAIAGSAILAGSQAHADTVISVLTTTQQASPFNAGVLTVNPGVDLVVDGSDAVFISDANQTINNHGFITGTDTAVVGGVSAIRIFGGGTTGVVINNFAGAIIKTETTTDRDTIEISSNSEVAIVNDGTITSTSLSAVNGGATNLSAIGFKGGNKGDLINNSTGIITSAEGTAIVLNKNFGGNGLVTFDGKIENSGLIQSTGNNAITINQSIITGDVTNKLGGSIITKSSTAVALDVIGVGNDFNITNSGTIQGFGAAISHGIRIASGDLTGDITNKSTGLITVEGTNSIAIWLQNSELKGNIVNEQGGTIRSNGTSGFGAIMLQSAGSKAGKIDNSGLIQANNAGNAAIEVEGTVTNGIVNQSTGKVEATGTTVNAILISSTGKSDIDNKSGGLITSSSTNVNANTIYVNGGTSKIVNDGTISYTGNQAGGAAIHLTGATASVTNVGPASGIIDGGVTNAIWVAGVTTGDIVNEAGAIIRNNAAGSGSILVTGTLTGAIDNAGTIQNNGTGLAVNLAGTVNGGLRNRVGGIIETDGTTAVALGQNTFRIDGGHVIGDTTGGNAAVVNFELAPITPSTFNPFDDLYGFGTEGNFNLATAGTSQINLNSGALYLRGVDTLTADSVNIDSDALMLMNTSSTVSLGAGNLVNKGYLIFDTGGQTITGGTLDSQAGSVLGFALRGGNSFAQAATDTTNVNGKVRIYNDYSAYTFDNTGTPATILTTTANGNLTVLSSAAGNVDADMDATFNNTATLAYQATSDANSRNLLLTVTRTAYNDLSHGFTPNQNAAGGALENIGFNGNDTGRLTDLLGALDSITSTTQLGNSLQQLLPVNNGAALYGSMVGFDNMMQSIDSRLANFGGMTASAGRTGLAGAPGVAPNNVWVRVGGGIGTQDGQAGRTAGFDGRTYYGVIGADREISEGLRIGGSFGYADSKFDGNGGDSLNSQTKVRNYQGSVYGAWNSLSSGWFATGILGGGGSHFEQKRTINITTPVEDFFDVKTADYNGWQVTGKGIVGLAFGAPNGPTLTPFASFRYTHIHLNGYTEDGQFEDDLSLTVKGQSYDQALPGIGVRLAAPIQSGGMTLLPWVRASYQYDVIGDRQVLTSTFGGDTGTPQTSFKTNGVEPGRHVFNAGGGVNVFAGGSFSMSLNYDFEKRNDGFTGHSGFVQARVGF